MSKFPVDAEDLGRAHKEVIVRLTSKVRLVTLSQNK